MGRKKYRELFKYLYIIYYIVLKATNSEQNEKKTTIGWVRSQIENERERERENQ